jgi:hypothetical protein
VSVKVGEQEINDELKKTSCYGGAEKKKTLFMKGLVKWHAQLLERINVLSLHIHGSTKMTIPAEDKYVKKLTVPDVVVKLMEAQTILTDFFPCDNGTMTNTRESFKVYLKSWHKSTRPTPKPLQMHVK